MASKTKAAQAAAVDSLAEALFPQCLARTGDPDAGAAQAFDAAERFFGYAATRGKADEVESKSDSK